MKYRIKISQADFEELNRLTLADHPREGAAFALAGFAVGRNITDVIVRRPVAIPKDLFNIQEEYHLRLGSKAINGLISLCEKNKLGAVLCHSHPYDIPYSPTDDFGEERIVDVLRQFIPQDAPTASLLFYPQGVRGRVWLPGTRQPQTISEIQIIGSFIRRILFERNATQKLDTELLDRQILAFGKKGQSLISAAKVGIVGVGGTGSPTAEQLIRLGVQDLLLIDKDSFEKSNLTRVYGTFASDLTKKPFKRNLPPKVELVAKHLRRINPKAAINAMRENVVFQKGATALLDRDVIFLCTDNHWSRSVVNEIAYQYFIPTINTGIRIDAQDDGILGSSVVDVLRPDLPCLWCRGAVRSERIMAESTPPKERQGLLREGYVEDVGTNAPAVISLTTTVSSLAVNIFLQLITGFMGEYGQIQRLNYDIREGTVRRGASQILDQCVCKKVRGYGNLKKLNILIK